MLLFMRRLIAFYSCGQNMAILAIYIINVFAVIPRIPRNHLVKGQLHIFPSYLISGILLGLDVFIAEFH